MTKELCRLQRCYGPTRYSRKVQETVSIRENGQVVHRCRRWLQLSPQSTGERGVTWIRRERYSLPQLRQFCRRLLADGWEVVAGKRFLKRLLAESLEKEKEW